VIDTDKSREGERSVASTSPDRSPTDPSARAMADVRSLERDSVEALVARYLPLARRLAGRYSGRGEPLEDLVQVASVGLVNAARRYDSTRGIAFAAYAIPTITGELKRHFRDHCWSVHVPRGAKDRAVAVRRAIEDGLERTGATPTATHLAQRLKLPEREVVDAIEAWAGLFPASLDAPARGSDPEPLGELIGGAEGGYDLVDMRLTLVQAVRRLSVTERRIFCMRYLEDRTQADIAARVGLSQMQVCRSLSAMRAKLQPLSPLSAREASPSDSAMTEPPACASAELRSPYGRAPFDAGGTLTLQVPTNTNHQLAVVVDR
jgi:RNA polymerase sigma-B factor